MYKICKTAASVFLLLSYITISLFAQPSAGSTIPASFTVSAIPSNLHPYYGNPTYTSQPISLGLICGKTVRSYIELHFDEQSYSSQAEGLSFINPLIRKLNLVPADAKWDSLKDSQTWFGTTFTKDLITTIQFPDLRSLIPWVSSTSYCSTQISITNQLNPYRVVIQFDNSSRRYFGTLIEFLPLPSIPVVSSVSK